MTATIDKLLAVTPYPPATDDITELITAATTVASARDAILATARPEPTNAALLAELEARQVAWTIALAAARAKLGGQQTGVRGLRAYAGHLR